VDRSQRRFLACLTVLAVLCALVQALTGVPELVLYLTPVFLIAALLLCGHYVAEEQIVRRWRDAARPPSRRIRTRWLVAHQAPLASLLERSPASPRGPPALVSLAA
jgi:hypothetical protein